MEGASWKSVGRQAGGSASGASRGSMQRRNWKVDRRRESKDRLESLAEDWSKAQAGGQSESRSEDRQAAQVAGRCEGGTGRLIGDAS